MANIETAAAAQVRNEFYLAHAGIAAERARIEFNTRLAGWVTPENQESLDTLAHSTADANRAAMIRYNALVDASRFSTKAAR